MIPTKIIENCKLSNESVRKNFFQFDFSLTEKEYICFESSMNLLDDSAMVNRELVDPHSIVVVGGSNNVHKPGGQIVRNLLDGQYAGTLYVVNAKDPDVQGVRTYASVEELPPVEMAILSVPNRVCPSVMEVLARQKGTKAFIVVSAGFGEETVEGGKLEQQMLDIHDWSQLYRLDEYAFPRCLYTSRTGV